MTDTRKYIDEQFDKFFEFDTDDKSTVTSTSCKLFAEHLIADLLAVIAKKDEALNSLHTLQYQSDSDEAVLANHSTAYDIAEKALAITPESVELVEVGKVNEVGGSLWASQYSPNNGVKVGDIVYTIKQKE